MSPRRGAKCRSCQAPVVFFRSPFTASQRTFDPKPVPATHALAGVRAFPVLGGTAAYRAPHLAELLQVQHHISDAAAEAEVRDLPWHLLHECPTPDEKDSPA